MTVTSTTSRRIHEGNDSATAFSFDFPVTAAADLVVTLTAADGGETLLAQDSDYAVSVAGYPGSGSIAYPLSGPPLPAGARLTIERRLTIDQQIDLQNQGNFYAETHEGFFDRIVMICQQLADAVGRTAKLPASSALGELFLPAPEAGRVLLWNAGADGLANGPEGDEIAAAQGRAQAAAGSADAAAGAQAGAEAARTAAEAAQAAAEAARAALSLPAIQSGDAGKMLRVRADESGQELRSPAEVAQDVGALTLGAHSILVPAQAIQPSPSGGCGPLADDGQAPTSPSQWFLPFDPATPEHAQLTLPTPKSWDAGPFEVAVLHAPGTTGGGAVRWVLRAAAASDGAAPPAWGADAGLTDVLGATVGVLRRSARVAVLPGGTPAAEDLLHLQVRREAADAADSHAGDARLLGLIVTFTLSRGTDA
ncbi:hypothetical protein SAMN06265365_12322 [Tistlia consotensis]|uniref:Uncharacterized protein n=1 Tax=Tistlia consotensis USBA 355 TaxID=560819 RepID=A0A1Y6CPZ5_9PROT|nr:hypothetical protein [Tistlia consotensis]SMF64728.1 hypothetical protein SAMN05428998_12587 [Tistlia consotensis USBA 355]SNR96833.1 hypothetical protein SAMN06265365_12322 [Tistlia consotensis]